MGSPWVGGKQQPENNDRQQLPPGLSAGALKGAVWTAAKRSACTLPNGAPATALCSWLPRRKGKPSMKASSFHFSREVGIKLFKNTEKLLNLNVSE